MHTEDDILHLENKELPTFGNVLSPSDSERFVQFLTAPYIRIPLIMDFFANGDPTRLSGLKTKSLQMIVDAALFEPGRWKPADYIETITGYTVDEITPAIWKNLIIMTEHSGELADLPIETARQKFRAGEFESWQTSA